MEMNENGIYDIVFSLAWQASHNRQNQRKK